MNYLSSQIEMIDGEIIFKEVKLFSAKHFYITLNS